MPRIYDSRSNPIDFCHHHFPTEERAEQTYGNRGDGPDGRGNCFAYDAEHPYYEGEDYCCQRCGARLTATDN